MLGRSVRTSQPQSPGSARIDWSNPITRGLVRALLCTDKRPIDVAGNAPVTVGRNTYTNGVHIAPQGKAVRAYNTPFNNGQEVTFPGWGSASGEASFVLLQHRVLSSASNAWVSTGSGGGQHFPFGSNVQASPFWNSRWLDAPPPVDKSFLTPHSLAVSVKNGSQRAFWDGRLFASAANSGGFVVPSTVALIQDDVTDMAYYNAMFFNRALSDAEIKSLSDNPWQIFAPDSKSLWTPAAASVSLPTLVRPTSTISAGLWLPTGAATLHETIDEEFHVDADYMSVNAASTVELELAEAAFPGGPNQTLAYWASSTQGSTLTVTLKQGVTTIMTRTHALTGTDTLYTQTLTAPEIALITAGAISVTLTTS